jgi:hypothetical protein
MVRERRTILNNGHFANIRPVSVQTDDKYLWVTLKDGRIIGTPLAWYPWLAHALPEEVRTVELLPDAIYWTDLDEGLEIEGMLLGIRPVYARETVA